MEFTAAKALPLVRDIIRPTIAFTGAVGLHLLPPYPLPVYYFSHGQRSFSLSSVGISTYVFNPDTGKIYRHIDVWDSISNQDFFSVEVRQDALALWGVPVLP